MLTGDDQQRSDVAIQLARTGEGSEWERRNCGRVNVRSVACG